MDVATILREVETWPAEERWRLLESLWDQMMEAGEEPELTEAQRAELRRRIAEADANPGNVLTSDDMQATLNRWC